MLKLHASANKKVPIPGVDYSTMSFSAGLEVEIADGATADQITQRIQDCYRLLDAAVNAEIAAHGGVIPAVPVAQPAAAASAPVATPQTPPPAPRPTAMGT
jgi:hypothetical protein